MSRVDPNPSQFSTNLPARPSRCDRVLHVRVFALRRARCGAHPRMLFAPIMYSRLRPTVAAHGCFLDHISDPVMPTCHGARIEQRVPCAHTAAPRSAGTHQKGRSGRPHPGYAGVCGRNSFVLTRGVREPSNSHRACSALRSFRTRCGAMPLVSFPR